MERPKHLGARVRVLSQNIKQAFDRKLTALGLTTQQSFVLRYLYEHSEEKVYPKDIEKRFDLTHPTVSGLIQRLGRRILSSVSRTTTITAASASG